MKRTADTSSSPAQGSYGFTPVPGGPAARHPATSTPPGQANPQNPPSIASSTGRTSTGLLAAPALQQPAVGNATAAADNEHPDLAGMTKLQVYVMGLIDKGCVSWTERLRDLQGETKERRNCFSLMSLYCMTAKKGAVGVWHGAVASMVYAFGMDFLFKQKWPDSDTFLHLLAATRNSKWLEAALATEGQKQALFLRNKRDHLPLHVAVLAGSTEIVQSLLAHDDDDGSMRLARSHAPQMIPLHHACGLHHDSIAVLLLSRKGEEQRLACSKEGFLPLHVALKKLNIEVVPHLLAERAMDQVLKQTDDGSNALILAASEGLAAAVDMLLAVPDTLAAQLEARDNNGERAIDFARGSGNPAVIARIEAAMQTLSATSTSTSTTSTSTAPPPPVIDEAPVPLTPAPPTPASKDNPAFSDTEEDLDWQ
jgi:ankyrin repeat protein